MNAGEQDYISFKGREISTRFYCEGVRSSGKSYYIMDQFDQEWKICSADRLAKLAQKFGSVEEAGKSYASRKIAGSTQELKGDSKRAKKVQKGIDEPLTPVSKQSSGLWIAEEFRAPGYDGTTAFDQDGMFA